MPKVRIDDALEMHYEDQDFTDPWRPSETIVMHHGNEKNGQLWYAWVPLLVRHYRIVRLDARGFGQSTVPAPGYNFSLDEFVDDLKRLIDFLGLDGVHLIGETMGGTVSLKFAHRYPERLKSLTVCNPPYKFAGVASFGKSRDEIGEGGMEAWVRRTMHTRLDPKQADPQHVEWYAQQMGKTAKHVAVGIYGALMGHDLTGILPEIQVPTLILASESTHAAQPDRHDGLNRMIPNSKLVVFPGTSGFIQHAYPELCVEAWKEFVAGLD